MLDFVNRLAANAESRVARLKSDLRAEVDDAATRAGAHLSLILAKAAAWIVAAIFLAVALAFATLAAYDALLAHFPPHLAALIVAGAYAAVALICIVVAATMNGPAKREPVEPLVAPPPAEPPPVPPEPAPESAATGATEGPTLGLAHIADLLGAVGRTQEQAALLAANEIAKSLTPPQLIAAGLAAGFILGRKIELPGRRPRDPA